MLQVSAYDPEVDGERRVVRTAVRAFDDRVALLTARTRDLGLVRVIAVRGTPRFTLEPGADAVDWSAADEGVSPRELAMAGLHLVAFVCLMLRKTALLAAGS